MKAQNEIDFLIAQADALLAQAAEIADAEVERIARMALRGNKNLHDFTMAMGTYFFGTETKVLHNYKYKKLDDFILKYNDELKMTGSPMNFTARGEKITDW